MEETLTSCDFPREHWTRIRTNNVIERLNQNYMNTKHLEAVMDDVSVAG